MRPSDRPKVLILGSGPNRIGQGIEFDYCCVHASFALRDAGYETIMLNCNPETVSTDYDTSDRLYFEPLTYEDVMNVIEAEQASAGPAARPGRRDRGARRADAAEAVGPPAHRARARHQPRRRSTWPRTASAGTRSAPASRSPSRPAARPPPSRRPSAIVGRIGYPRPDATELRARRPGHGDRLRRREPAPGHGRAGRLRGARRARAGCRPSGRCSSTASSRTPPRSTSTPSATTPARSSSAASWSTSRKPACTRATAPAPCRPTRSPPTPWPSSRTTPGASPRRSTSAA